MSKVNSISSCPTRRTFHQRISTRFSLKWRGLNHDLRSMAAPDGLDAYRAIIAALPRLLKPGGAFALEVGIGQAEDVRALAEAAGLSTGPPKRDLAGIPVW